MDALKTILKKTILQDSNFSQILSNIPLDTGVFLYYIMYKILSSRIDKDNENSFINFFGVYHHYRLSDHRARRDNHG